MKTSSKPPLHFHPRGYTDADLCAYAYHVWVQSGMPCIHRAWDEAKACLDANLPRQECGRPAPRRASRRRTVAAEETAVHRE